MGVSLRNIISQLEQAGRGPDTMLAHITPAEAARLKREGGSGTINPKTGLREFRPTGSWGGNAASGGRVSGSLGNTGNGGNVGAGRSAGRPATGHQAALTQASTGQNLTDAGDDVGGRTSASAGRGPVAPGSWSSTPDAPVGGGTYTTDTYSPGAVENHPDANLAAVADMLSSAVPLGGLLNTAYKGAKAAVTGSDPLSSSAMGPIGDAFGGDPGPQRGWAPDRNHGAVNPFGSDGSAQGTVFTNLKPKIVQSPLAAALAAAQPPQKIKTYSSATTVL